MGRRTPYVFSFDYQLENGTYGVDMVVFVCVPAYGERFVYLAWALWWIDVVISVVVGYGVCFMMYVHS